MALAPRRPPAWFFFSLLSVLAWGLWGLLSKVVTVDLDATLTHGTSTVGALAVLPLVFIGGKAAEKRPASTRGLCVALLAGIFGSAGNVLVYRALGMGGLASIVFPLSALYPLVTVALAVAFLRERLGAAQILGLALALAAILGLSVEPPKDGSAPSLATAIERPWLWLSAGALLVWGVSGALQKLSTESLSPGRSYMAFSLGYVATAIVLLAATAPGWGTLTARTALYGTLSGVLNGLGVLALFAALARGGKASVVVPLTALYPIVTLVLAVSFLGERPAGLQTAGAGAAVAAGALLAREREPRPAGDPVE